MPSKQEKLSFDKMIMDAEDVQSDLHALKRLYGLLKKDGGEASNTDSDSLDAPARLLLKNLLDTATRRVLKSHSEAVSGQPEASGARTPFPARPQQPDDAASMEGYQSCEEIDFDDRLTQDRSQAREVSVPALGLRRCSICRRNTVNPVPTGDVARYSSISDRERQRQRQRQSKPDRMAIDASKVRRSESISEPEESDCLSQEASRAIQKIEGCMSALHMGADHLQLLEKPSGVLQQHSRVQETDYDAVPIAGTSSGHNFLIRNNPLFEISEEERNQPYLSLSQSYNPVRPIKAISKQPTTDNVTQRGPVSHADALGILEEEKYRLPTKEVNKIYVQNVNAIVENVEPGNWIVSSNRYVPGSLAPVPSNKSYITRWPATSLSNMEDEHFRNLKNHPPYVQPGNLVNNQSDARHKAVSQRSRHYRTAVRTSLQDPESQSTATATATDSYSNWSSNKTSSRDSNSEDSDQTRGLNNVASSKSSGSSDLSLSHGSGTQYSWYGSESEEEVYSSSSGKESHEVTSSTSSEEERYSSPEQSIRSHARPKYASKQSTSKKSGPSKIEKAHKKQTGMLKRMKDRLAVIFHHHHHHHHHHHNRSDQTNNEENTSQKSSSNKHNHKSSPNKHKEKGCSPKRQDDPHREKDVEKIRKSQIREKRGQHSHFQGLMGGLLKHVQHSKKSKKGKGTADLLAHEHGKKRTPKKNWWKLLQHHGQSKLHDKAHMKLGLGKKKNRLKALPNIE